LNSKSVNNCSALLALMTLVVSSLLLVAAVFDNVKTFGCLLRQCNFIQTDVLMLLKHQMLTALPYSW